MSDGHDFRHVTPSVGYGTKSRVLLLSAVVCFFVCFSYATTVTCCGHALLWPPLLFPYCLTTIIEQRMVSLLLASVGLVLAVASSSPVAAQNTTVQTTKGAISGVVVGDDDSVFAYWGYDLTQTTCLVLSPNLFFYLFLFLWSTHPTHPFQVSRSPRPRSATFALPRPKSPRPGRACWPATSPSPPGTFPVPTKWSNPVQCNSPAGFIQNLIGLVANGVDEDCLYVWGRLSLPHCTN